MEIKRHPDWVKVEKKTGSISKGQWVRAEWFDEFENRLQANEFISTTSFTDHGFSPDVDYYVLPFDPVENIPVGRENATVLSVSVTGSDPVVGTYWRGERGLYMLMPRPLTGLAVWVCEESQITSAELVEYKVVGR